MTDARSPEDALTTRVEYEGTAAFGGPERPAPHRCRMCGTIIDPVMDTAGLCVECEADKS